MKEEIIFDGQLCAIIVRANYDEPGIQFFTSNELSLQLASMSYTTGKVIPAHTHNLVTRHTPVTRSEV